MRIRTFAALSAGTLAGALAFPAQLAAQNEASSAVEQTLDAFHRAASEADGATYFDLFREDGVFLGTDATERWTVPEFRAYAEPFFSQGRGWTYTLLERHVSVAPGGDVAWFDERLTNSSLGETRGSGVLLREGDRWKVAQYNLTIPIPNEMAGDVARRIREIADVPKAEGADEPGE